MRSYDDIENEKKQKATKELRNDLNNLIGGVFDDIEDMMKRKKIEKEIKEKRRKKTPIERLQAIFLYILMFGIGLFIVNFVLGNFWLLRFFIKSLVGLE